MDFGGPSEAVLWKTGAVQQLAIPGPSEFDAWKLNGLDEVAGTLLKKPPHHRAAVWTGDQVIDLVDVITTGASWASDINDAGFLTGYALRPKKSGIRAGAFVYNIHAEDPPHYLPRKHKLHPGYPSAINSAGQVVGLSWIDGESWPHAYLYSDGETHDLAPARHGFDINDAGLVIGGWEGPPFMYDFGAQRPEVVFLSSIHPALGSGTAWAVNNHGEIVGDSNARAFHLHDGVLTDLNDALVDGDDWQLTWAQDINDAGEIVGVGIVGRDSDRRQAGFLLTPERKWLRDRRLESLIRILFGITSDGGGLAVGPSGQPVPVDPLGWRALAPEERARRVRGIAGELADLVDDETLRSELERVATGAAR